MDYEIKEVQAEGYCVVTVSGPLKRPDDSFLLQDITAEIASRKGVSRFLLDLRKAQVVGGTIDTYEVGVRLPRVFEPGTKAKGAVVYSELTSEHRFLEDVLVNRGLNIRVFSDEANALAWLKSDSDDEQPTKDEIGN
jgi:hypothetical protein